MQPGVSRQRAEGGGGSHDLGSHLQQKEATFGRHQGLEHQSSAIPADWHQPGEGAGSAAAAPGHVHLTVGTEPPLSRESSSSSDAGSSSSPWAGTWEAAAPNLRLAAWLALLFVGYGFQRGLCAAGLPYDCDSADAADVFNSLTLLTFLGGALAWLAGVTNPARFDWLAAPRRAYLWIVYLAILPAYSGIASIPAMRVSLATMDQWGPAPIILKVVVGVIGVTAVAFHIWLALRCAYIAADGSVCASCGSSRDLLAVASRAAVAPEVPKEAPGSPSGVSTASGSGSEASLAPSGGSVTASLAASLKSWASRCQLKLGGGDSGSSSPAPGSPRAGGLAAAQRRRRLPRGTRRKALAIYLLPRVAVLLYFFAWCLALPLSGSYSLHLHHYVLGWAVACFAAFNHPISGLLLAFGTAIFVQGAGAYGFDPLFTKTNPEGMGCLTVPSPSTGQMTCAFWSDKPFNISFCSNTSYIPWFDCGVDWPWPATKVWPNGKKPNKTARLTTPTPITLSLSG